MDKGPEAEESDGDLGMTKKELLEELNFKYKIDDWEKNEMVVEVFERIKYEIVQRLEREEAKAAAEKVKAMLLSLHEPEVVTPEPGQIWRSKSWKRQVKVVDVFNMGSQEPLVTYKYLDGDYIDWIRVNRRWYLEVFEFVRESEDDLHKNPENLGTSSEPSQKVGTCQKTPISESLQQEDCKKRAFVQPSHETPEHYRLDPEPIAVIKAWDLGFCLGNVIKYLARAGHKAGESRDKDLHKAMEYLRIELEDQADAKESTAARRCC